MVWDRSNRITPQSYIYTPCIAFHQKSDRFLFKNKVFTYFDFMFYLDISVKKHNKRFMHLYVIHLIRISCSVSWKPEIIPDENIFKHMQAKVSNILLNSHKTQLMIRFEHPLLGNLWEKLNSCLIKWITSIIFNFWLWHIGV